MSGWMELMNSIAERWSSGMWPVLWQSTVLAAIVFLLTIALRKASSGLRFWLWMLVPLRLAIMPLVTVSLPLLPAQTPTSDSPPPLVLVDSVIEQEPQKAVPPVVPVVKIGTSSFSSSNVDYVPPAATESPIHVSSISQPSIRTWLFVAWLIGVALFVLRLIRGWYKCRRLIGRAHPVSDPEILAVAHETSQRIGLRFVPRLVASDDSNPPFTMGVIDPVVALPTTLIEQVSPGELLTVLSHEFAHIRRRDSLIGWFLGICEALYYFHPIFHLAKRQSLREREQACDETVLASRLAQPGIYARALITAASACGDLRHRAVPVTAVAESFGDLKKRVTAICSMMTPRARLSKVSLVGLVLLAVVSLPGIVLTARSIAQPTDSSQGSLFSAKDWTTGPAPKGIVIDESGKPISDARVQLYFMDSRWGLGNKIVESVTTKADGQFALTQPLKYEDPNGTDYTDHYILFATHPNYALSWHKIVSGAELESYRLTMTEPVKRELTVTDMEGTPLPGARVWIYQAGSQEDSNALFRSSFLIADDLDIASATTDEQGRAIVSNLPKTNCSFHASLKGYADGLAFWRGKRIRLNKGGSVFGSVLTNQGKPVSNATVRFSADWMHQYYLTKTDALGRYHFEDLPAKGWDTNPWGDPSGGNGTYDVSVQHADFAAKPRPLKLDPGESIAGFDFTAVEGTLLRVKVLEPETDLPIGGARVQGNSPSGRLDGYTDSEGIVEWRVVSGKTHLWLLSPPGDMYFVEDGSRRRAQTNVEADGGIKEITLHASARLGRLTTLRGKLVLPDGTPAAGLKISTTNASRYSTATFGGAGGAYTATNPDGTFELERVPAGLKLFLYAHTDDYQYVLAKVLDNVDGPTDLAQPLVMQAGQVADVLVTDEKGEPRANMKLKIRPRMWDGNIFRADDRKVKTDAEGRLKIDGIIPGMEYFLRDARADLSESDWPKYFHQNIKLIPSSQHIDESSTPGKPHTVTAVMSDKMAVSITDPDGKPMPIKSISQLYVYIEDGRWSMGGSIDIEGRLKDTSVLIDRKHLALAKSGHKMEIMVVTEDGQPVVAKGTFPDDASNHLLFVSETPLATQSTSDHIDVAHDEVAGRVIDAAGKPVKGAKVTIYPRFPAKEWPIVTTDAKGVFSVPGFGDSHYTYVEIEAPNLAIDWVTDLPVGKGFTVMLDSSSRLSGAFETPEGKPAGPTTITLTCDKLTARTRMGSMIHGIRIERQTDGNGALDIPLPPGTYEVRVASILGYYARLPEVEVRSGKTTSLPGELQPGVRLEAKVVDHVTGDPVVGQQIWIEERLPSFTHAKEGSQRTTDPRGIVVWDSLMPGETRFGSSLEGGPYVRWWSQDASTPWGRKNPDADSGGQWQHNINSLPFNLRADMPPVVITMEKGVKISGKVLSPDGKPVPEAMVFFTGFRTGDMRYMMMTDEQGRFGPTIGDRPQRGYVPAGKGITYRLCAKDTEGEWYDHQGRWANAISEPFNSKPGDELEFTLRMSKGGRVLGQVVDPDGKRVADVEVEAVAQDGLDSPYVNPRTITDEQGRYTLGPVRAGDYRIQADARKGVNISQEPAQQTRTVTVIDGHDTTTEDLTFIRPPGGDDR